MTRIAFVDLASGAAGDMLMAALAHAGRRSGKAVDEAIQNAVTSLDLGCSVRFQESSRGGLHCLTAKVSVPDTSHDPDALAAAIQRSKASEESKNTAIAGLEAIIAAEASVHGTSPADVHLHDLGSADTAADLLGVAVGFEALDVTAVSAGPVPAPRGWVHTQGGTLPLPSPATLEMLRNVPMYGVAEEAELVTPTAAAILVGHRASFGEMPALVLEQIGVGGGTRELARPNVCRVLIGRAAQGAPEEPSPVTARIPAGLTLERDVLLETNIDDQTPEMLAEALAALLAAGVKDAWFTPIVMKKSRPAFQLAVLVSPEREGEALEVLFRHTTTLGARRRETTKWVLDRDVVHVPVRGTNIRVKVGRLSDEIVTISPEFDDCLTVSTRTGVGIMEVYAEAAQKARRMLGA